MTRFVVDLGNAHVSDDKKNRIAAGIQALVIGELADLDFGGQPRPIGLIPPGWRGYILREELKALEAASGEIQGFANRAPGRE
jgi:hypothetical protein